MKIISLFLFLLLSANYGISQNVKYYAIGDKLNVRSGPNTDAKILYQVNFGDHFYETEEPDDGWLMVLDNEDINVFVSAKYLKKEDAFIPIAETREDKNGKTYFELIEYYQKKDLSSKLEEIIHDVLSTIEDQEVWVGFENFVSLHAVAYRSFPDKSLENLKSWERRYKGPFMKNYIQLDMVKYYVKHDDISKAIEMVETILQRDTEFLRVNLQNDYDGYGDAYPQTDLKNYCYSIYHLGEAADMMRILEILDKLGRESPYEKNKKIAREIWGKLSGSIWQIH